MTFADNPYTDLGVGLRAQLLWMLKLDAHLADWAIPDGNTAARTEETR